MAFELPAERPATRISGASGLSGLCARNGGDRTTGTTGLDLDGTTLAATVAWYAEGLMLDVTHARINAQSTRAPAHVCEKDRKCEKNYN
jgi:hypothetical protein